MINEVAPPTAKHERMVKHIKKSYKKDGKLTDDEKSIAYATAWKNYNKEEVVNEIKRIQQEFPALVEAPSPVIAMDNLEVLPDGDKET